jgi:hypothetical protein
MTKEDKSRWDISGRTSRGTDAAMAHQRRQWTPEMTVGRSENAISI